MFVRGRSPALRGFVDVGRSVLDLDMLLLGCEKTGKPSWQRRIKI